LNLNNINSIHFIGIGGIGMSNLARYFLSKGVSVSGYDRTESSITNNLINEGATIHYVDELQKIKNLDSLDLVVYTPAIPEKNTQLLYFKSASIRLIKRAELLGVITKDSYCIAVAGTHGKTTTSCIVAHMLESSELGCTGFLGGIATNYNSNFILNSNSKYVVVEADEYDRSFLHISPDVVILTSIDADHLDVYGDEENVLKSFQEFVDLIPQKGSLISSYGVKINRTSKTTYGENETANYNIVNQRVEAGAQYFDLAFGSDLIQNIQLGIQGRHNIHNAVAVFALGLELGIDIETIKHSFSTFKGVKRRFEYIVKTDSLIYIDDYAHHPKEIDACLSSVKDLFPNKKITVVFQPHLYSRTKDFLNDFGKSLSIIDEVILLDIYPARELPIPGVSSSILLEKISCKNKMLVNRKELIPELKNRVLEVLLTLGAGDINELVSPINSMLNSKISVN
jgi:UDP-N-acetylmuramate--alanine ligase